VSRILVTGAGGFVGRFAVEALKERGFEVHGVARRPIDGVEVDVWREADLLEPSAAARVVHEVGASHLLHLAWTTEHGRFWEDPANRSWVTATMRLIETFAEARGSRIVVAGSCAQYDWSSRKPLSETDSPRRPATLYGRAKQDVEALLEAMSAETGTSSATALLFFPYGPYERAGRLVPSVARRLLVGEEAMTSPGTQVRDFLHVADCGAALAALVDSSVVGPVNVGSGEGTAVAEVARSLARIVGRPELLRLGALPGDDETSVVARTGRLRNEVGFTPRFGLEDGLRDSVDWWRQRVRRK
jgi:nucleoside-diphosphate-sugar epimerase